MNLLTSILIEKAVGKSTFGCCIKVAKILLFLLMLCCQMLVFKSTERFKKLQIQFIFQIEIKITTNADKIASTLFHSKAVTAVNTINVEHNLNNIVLEYKNNFIEFIENISGHTTTSVKDNVPIFKKIITTQQFFF